MDQSIVSIHEAMKAVTIDAAWQIHKDDILGSLTKNKKADLLILSKNPYEVMLPIVCYSLLKCVLTWRVFCLELR